MRDSTDNTQRSRKQLLRVLIADDSQQTRRTTRLMLSMLDQVRVVAMARNGLETIREARQHNPDIALIDINMPELDGLSALYKIRSELPGMVPIIISAERQIQTVKDAVTIGAIEYMVKPFTAEELEQAINRAADLVYAYRQRLEAAKKEEKQYVRKMMAAAGDLIREKRTDDEAVQVFENLAEYPQCDERILRHLAMVYVVRQDWEKLARLAERLKQRDEEKT